MQPPARLSGLGGSALVPAAGFGQVCAVTGIYASIWNGAFGKWLANIVPAVASKQSAGNGGEVRLKSFCSRQAYGAPACPTWTVWFKSALARPFTPSHPP